MSYEIGGVQYVAVAAGWGGGGWAFVPRYAAAYTYGNENRLFVFKLGGGPVKKPPPLPPLAVAPVPPPQAPGVTPETILKGQALFFANCAICHSNQLRSISPDLRRMPKAGTRPVHADRSEWIAHARRHAALGRHSFTGRCRCDPCLSDRLAGQTRTKELALKRAGKPLDAPSLAIMKSY